MLPKTKITRRLCWSGLLILPSQVVHGAHVKQWRANTIDDVNAMLSRHISRVRCLERVCDGCGHVVRRYYFVAEGGAVGLSSTKPLPNDETHFKEDMWPMPHVFGVASQKIPTRDKQKILSTIDFYHYRSQKLYEVQSVCINII